MHQPPDLAVAPTVTLTPADRPVGEPTPSSEAAAVADAGRRRRRGGRGVGFWLALGWLGTVVVAAAFAPWLPVADPVEVNVASRLQAPGLAHPLGTDGLGRDLLARVVHGARVSLVVSVSAVGIGMVVGGLLGVTTGYVRGPVETVVMAAVDVVLAFPGLILLLVLLAFVGRSLGVISLVIGFLSIPIATRVARANTLAVAEREFVRAATVLGASRARILLREVLPNVVLPVAAFGLVAMGVVIVLEGSLAFLGLSVQPPDPTWGGMIADSRGDMGQAVHVALVPSAAMFLTVLSLNFVGDTLRRDLDRAAQT